MKVQDKPDYLVFASDAKTGELQAFPNITRGWGLTTDQTQSKPPLSWMNGAFNRLDENMLYLLQQGVPEWDSSVLYPVDAVIKYKSQLYIALVENDNSIPASNTEKWQKLIKDASIEQKGIVQLSSAIDSDSEQTAATSKAVNNVAKMAKNAGLPVGHIYWNTNLDSSSLHLNGSLHDRSAYAELWQYVSSTPHLLVTEQEWQDEKWANGGICNKFSTGDGLTTFRLPIFDYIKGGGLGYQKAGIPNIKGTITNGLLDNARVSDDNSSFTVTQGGIAWGGGTGDKLFKRNFEINASSSNSIYGASNSVDIHAVCGFWQIKAIGQIINVGNTNIDNMLNQINLFGEQFVKHDEFPSIFNRNGYQKLPSGLIIQWLSNGTNSDGYADSILPIEFPNSLLSAIVTEAAGHFWSANSGTFHSVDLALSTKSTIRTYSRAALNGSVVANGSSFVLIAIGY
ncbi:phage tail protein [Orbus sturtevantii]|uniref:phage tail protein n=1 Tax=Orbus sturtevantii TaxID=3074109 RepID=UPI00370DCF85